MNTIFCVKSCNIYLSRYSFISDVLYFKSGAPFPAYLIPEANPRVDINNPFLLSTSHLTGVTSTQTWLSFKYLIPFESSKQSL